MAVSDLLKRTRNATSTAVKPKLTNHNLTPTGMTATKLTPKLTAKPATDPFDLGTAYDNNLKMKYRQDGISALKPVEPFKMDLASIQSDPTYQAAMASAKEATQVAEGNISAAMNRRGIMDSSINANAASNAAQQEYGRVNRELLPQLIEDQYKRYMDQNATNRQYASDMFGVSDMYNNDDQQDFSNAITESGVTGSYMPPGARQAIDKLNNLKATTEQNWMSMTPAERTAATKQADNIRLSLQTFGVDPSLFGANVTANQATRNANSAGIKTMAGRTTDQNILDSNRGYDRGVLESDRNFDRGVLESDRAFDIDKTNATIQQRGATLSNQLAALQLENYPEEQRLRIEQMRKDIAQIGKDPYQSAADQRMDELKLEMSELELEKMRNGTTDTKTADDMRTYFDSMVQRDPISNNVTNADALENAILSSELSDYDSYQLYLRYGLKWGGEPPKK